MAGESDASIGKLLDQVAQPFLEDQARLEVQLAEADAARVKLEKRIRQIQRDQRVVRSAMIEALREASRRHPLLAAAFFQDPSAAPEQEERSEAEPPLAPPAGEAVGEPLRRSPSNPLLHPRA